MALSANATATATLVATPANLLGVYVRAAGTAGTLTLRDGGGSGTVKLIVNTPAAVGAHFLPITGGGIQFATDIHATLTTADAVTIIYNL